MLNRLALSVVPFNVRDGVLRGVSDMSGDGEDLEDAATPLPLLAKGENRDLRRVDVLMDCPIKDSTCESRQRLVI